MNRLREAGENPFKASFDRTHTAAEATALFEGLPEGEDKTPAVRCCGRMKSFRSHGKTTFVDLRDESGKIQIYIKKDTLGEDAYSQVDCLDIGDWIGVAGTVFRTKRGEITIKAQEITLLAKCLRPLPEKWHGLSDVELRYRQRYLDLIANPDVREAFNRRSGVVAAMRKFLDERGFLEVATPMMHSIPGGAAAKPFVTHHNALDIDLYLRIAPELYLKRLIVGGFERIFEINTCFRNEGISTRHNPEFTMLELYWAYVDYTAVMSLVEEMISAIAEKVLGTTKIAYQGSEIDLAPPWRRVSLLEAIREHSGVDFEKLNRDEEAARRAAREAGVDVGTSVRYGKVVDEVMKTKVAPNLIQPTFLVDYPIELSPLARRKEDAPHLTERFQAFVGGLEIGNAFSELNDPIDQRERFEEQLRARAAGDEEAHPMDNDYILALEYGLPPTGGLGIGIDRLVMLLTDQTSIRDVILFPQMKPSAE